MDPSQILLSVYCLDILSLVLAAKASVSQSTIGSRILKASLLPEMPCFHVLSRTRELS